MLAELKKFFEENPLAHKAADSIKNGREIAVVVTVAALLTDGGEIFMAMQETFYATRFAMFRDRFGTSWMLMHPRSQNG